MPPEGDWRRICMIRDDLESIPAFELPTGFAFRWYRPGNEADWVAIHQEADAGHERTERKFVEEFGTDPVRLAERMCFLCTDDGEAIGTATAWPEEQGRGAHFGRLHYVAIRTAFQGRGLARPLLTTVLRRMRQLGHTASCLGTQVARWRAVNLYLKFGYRPEIRDDADRDAWRAVRERLPASPLADMEL